jgi:hypothetical protein
MLHVPDPESLSDEELSRQWARARFLLKKGYLYGVKYEDKEQSVSDLLNEEDDGGIQD